MIFFLNFRFIFASLLFTIISQSSNVDIIRLNNKENIQFKEKKKDVLLLKKSKINVMKKKESK
jgi:hypothetical protein